MPSRKYPDAQDRGDDAVRRFGADVFVLDDHRRRRRQTPHSDADNEPDEPGSDGSGAQDEPR